MNKDILMSVLQTKLDLAWEKAIFDGDQYADISLSFDLIVNPLLPSIVSAVMQDCIDRAFTVSEIRISYGRSGTDLKVTVKSEEGRQ